MKTRQAKTDFVSLTLNIPTTLYKEVKVIAEEENKSRTYVIVEAVEKLITTKKEKTK